MVLLHQGGDINFVKTAKDEDGFAVMHEACKRGCIPMLDWLVAKRVKIDIRTFLKKKTPLMIAAENDRLDVCLYLLRRGAMATINERDVEGRTVLHYAACHASANLNKVLSNS